MRRALGGFRKTGMLSTSLAGLFAVLTIVGTVGIMAWIGGGVQGMARFGKPRGQGPAPNGTSICCRPDRSICPWLGQRPACHLPETPKGHRGATYLLTTRKERRP